VSDIVEGFLRRLHHPVLAGIDLSLDRMLRLLSVLGNPHKRLPPVVHVAGTNGKGSLIIYLQSILEAAGYRVHRYTSPHLVHFRERMILAGQPIDDPYLAKLLAHVATVLPGSPATFFEATTAVAFLAFSERKADVLLLETGMGGRLDATNVVEKPLLTAITPVDIDHTEYLGTTLTAIAGEKAGIIKRGVPCVVGRQQAEAMAVLEAKAASMGAPLSRLGSEWQVEGNIYRSATQELVMKPSLVGNFQLDNAATAIACIEKIVERMPQFNISAEHIATGLGHAVWPGRLQPLKTGKFAKLLPEGFELWLDGGHNAQGGKVLAQWLAEKKTTGVSVHLVCGMVAGKDSTAYFQHIAPYADKLYGIAISGTPYTGEPQSKTAEQVAASAKAAGLDAVSMPSAENALQTIAQHVKKPAIVVICGSLYLVRSILQAMNKEGTL